MISQHVEEMSKTAVVDSTVLTDVLIKSGERRDNARNALETFDKTLLPMYAIKEFKHSPLQHYAWAHNAIVDQGEVGGLFQRIGALLHSQYHKRKASTALEALKNAFTHLGSLSTADLVKKHGDNARVERVMADRLRLALRQVIEDGWDDRHQIADETIGQLACYEEKAPFMERGRIQLRPRRCDPSGDCCLAALMKQESVTLEALIEGVHAAPDSRENRARATVLKTMKRKPKQHINDKECRAIGDAAYAFHLPDEGVVLTTNTKDHKPLAQALGRGAVSPDEVNDRTGTDDD